MKKDSIIKKSFLILAGCVIFASSCSLKATGNDYDKQTGEVFEKDFNKNIAVDMVAGIMPLYDKNRNLISISNITDFGDGYIFLMKFTGDGGGISLYYTENKDGEWIVDKFCKSEMAMSPGIKINTVVLKDKMIVYGDVGTYTYIPETDEQKNVDFSMVKLISADDEETVIDIQNDSQFLQACDIFDVKSWSVLDKDGNEILNTKSEMGGGVYENIKEMDDYIENFTEETAIDMVAESLPLYRENRDLINISDIMDFEDGYMFIMKYAGDETEIKLYFTKYKNDKWIITDCYDGKTADNYGIGINTLELSGKMIIYGDVGDTCTFGDKEQEDVDFGQIKLTADDKRINNIDVQNNSRYLKVFDAFNIASWSVLSKNRNEIINSANEAGLGICNNV